MKETARNFQRGLNVVIMMLAALLVSGCETWDRIGESAPAEPTTAKYPVDPDIAKQTKSPYRTLKDSQGVLLGDLKVGASLPALFGGKGDAEPQSTERQSGESGESVNTFLWRASLDTVAFMPVEVADVQGGVIQTDWYEDRDRPNERFKVNIFVISNDLSADGVQVGVFREGRTSNGDDWSQAEPSPQTAEDLKTIIVDRAKELRGIGDE